MDSSSGVLLSPVRRRPASADIRPACSTQMNNEYVCTLPKTTVLAHFQVELGAVAAAC